MRLGYTVKFAHMALGLVPEILDAVDVISFVCKELGMVDTKVLEFTNIQHIIAPPAIRVDNAVRCDLAFDDGV